MWRITRALRQLHYNKRTIKRKSRCTIQNQMENNKEYFCFIKHEELCYRENRNMRKPISFEEKGEAEIKMTGMNSFFTEIIVKLNCYYDPNTSSFTSPVINFEFIHPINGIVLEELERKCKEGKHFKIIISKSKEEYPKILEGCI